MKWAVQRNGIYLLVTKHLMNFIIQKRINYHSKFLTDYSV